jgi:rsbT co-antagonist protein RsbR
MVQKTDKSEAIFSKMPKAFGLHEIIEDPSGRVVDYRFLAVNEAFEAATGLAAKAVLGKTVCEVIPGIEKAEPNLIEVYGRVAQTGESTSFDVFFAPFDRWYQISAYCPRKGTFAVVFDDITASKKTAAEVLRLNDELARQIAFKDAFIAELSIPTIKLWDKILLVPIVGGIDERRAGLVLERLLESIVEEEASIAILDVTGVPSIDTQVASYIVEAITASRMLGASVLISGISPETAMSLVRLGIDVDSINATGTLKKAVAMAFAKIRQQAEPSS